MSEPVSHRALLTHPQVMAAAIKAHARARPSPWIYTVVLLAALVLAVWAGHLLGFQLVQELPFEWMFAVGVYVPTVVPALLAFAGVALAGWFYNALARRTYLRQFKALGIPLEIDALFEILPDELRLTTDRIVIAPKWAAVDTVENGAAGWVISADHLTFLVPHDSFAGKDAERAFVAALVAHLTEAARARSAEAVAFAADSALRG
jgi:hypothetical protein